MRNTKIIGIRLDESLYKILKRAAEARGEDVSSFGRRAIKKELARMGYLSEEEKKALGLGGASD